jgi:nucleoside-diphosphate-sugar epimerase
MIFLTGGTGMLGAHLLLDLTKSGEKVRALKRPNSDLSAVRKIFQWYSDQADALFEQIEWLEGDLLDGLSLPEGLEGVDTVIHAAAKVSFDPRDRAVMLHENPEGTANLVDLCIRMKISRFCHVSSIAALGGQDSGFPADENFAWKNDRHRSAYSESKFLSEMEVWRGIHEGLPAVIVNPSVILGPGNWNNGSPRMFKTVGDGLKFYTRGSTGFVDVRDVSKAIIALLRRENWDAVKGQRFIVSAENRPYREVVDMIAVALNRPKPAIRANGILLQLGWRASRIASILTGNPPALTKETARSALRVSAYDGSKICRTINFEYRPIETTIRDIASIFLNANCLLLDI